MHGHQRTSRDHHRRRIGTGAATAQAFVKAGAKVALLDINLAAGEHVADKLGGIAVKCDVTDDQSATDALSEVQTTNTASAACWSIVPASAPPKRIVGRDGPMPLADYKKVIEINLIGTFNMMRLFAAALMQGRTAGRRRARRDHFDRVGRSLRGPDRPGRLFVIEGRRRGADHAGGA